MRGERRDTMEAERPLEADVCCHQLFEHQVVQHPERVALEVGELRLTYRELDRRADRLSGDLRARGVGPEVPVAICLDRSAEMVIAVLAVLKAGAGYVPLDLEYPRQRLALMLQSARSQMLLTRRKLVERLPEHDAEVLVVDSEREHPSRPSSLGPRGANLAYVVFTSGSTGEPKGIAMPHRPLTNLIRWQLAQSPSEAASRTLQFAPFGFDVSFQEIFATLGAGGTLVLPSEEQRRNSAQLLELLETRRVTRLFVPFVALRQLAEIAREREAYPSALREIITAGEALQITPALSGLMQRLPACSLINQYGPAECHVVTAHALDRAQVEKWPPLPPIGREIEGAYTSILDEAGQPISGQEAGELYLGGVAVFRGYLHRPGTTAARCLPDALSQTPGGRLYRTGDLARFLPEGAIEFLGRADHQVKLRGYRIELGEIEVTLANHSAVRQSVVTVHESATGARRLVAYVVPVEPSSLQQRELVKRLRNHVRKWLPEYMVPASVVLLERWPLNPHGKVDRGALPAPSERPEQEYVAPRDPMEKRLVEVWARVLGTSKVGVHDDFLELGGDSLLGATIVNQLYDWLGEPVYVSAIFEAPTVAELAAYLDKHYREAMARLRGDTSQASGDSATQGVGDADISRLRRLIPAPTLGPAPVRKNPPAIFVLAPPRSGSSVFRIMLGGHPELFAPPELELLGFGTLDERRAALSGGSRFLREGTVRALMDLESCPPDRAEAIMADYETRGMSTQDFFGVLQERIGGRRLVDKTTSYPLHLETLQRAEEIFDGALYLHLVRHPGATVHSFRKARIDRLLRFEHPYTPRQLGELLWWISHRNIERFLTSVPAERQLRVSFEELVRRPEPALEDICQFLGIEFHADMADPYSRPEERMTDGLYAGSIGLTDFKFHRHKKLDPTVADRWREHFESRELCDASRRLARALGYDDMAPTAPASRVIEPTPAAKDHPLSFAQQRLWFLDQLGVGSAFNSSRVYRLAGELDVSALATALSAIVSRHQTLRTRFVDSSGEPRQIIDPASELSLPVVDLSALSENHRELVSQSLGDSQMHLPFDLTAGSLLRAVLLRLSSKDPEHLLVLAIHHIVTDGWSWGVLQEELQEAYRAAISGQALRLAELTIQYTDYACWQRRWLDDEDASRGLKYWRDQLGGTAPVLELPFDRPRPRVLSARGGSVEKVLDREVARALQALSQEAGASLFMTLLTAFKVLLMRVTDQPRIWVGTSVAGRTHRELEGLIGFFLNFLVLRSDFSDEPSFFEALARVRRVALDAYDHQEIPFEKLLEDLQPERDLGRNPLFQTYCNMVHRSYSERGSGTLALEIVDSSSAAARFDLDLHLVEHSDGLNVELRYKEELFDAATVERLLAWFLNLLEGAVADPEKPVPSLALLGAAEREQLLSRRNGIAPDVAGTDFPAAAVEQTLPARFAQQVERDPEQVAIQTHSESWTYRQLDLASNRVARSLQGLVGELGGEHVALLFGPGATFLEGLWGVLKAGHAYVSLDPSYPLERLRFVLADSKATAIVTESSQVELARSLVGESAPLLIIDQMAEVSSELVACPASPDSLAYILYTSGSTGRPKGVMQNHRGVLGHARAYARALRIAPEDRLTLLSSYTFDAAAMDLYGALLCGATVCPLPLREQALDDLLATMSKLGITIYHSTPSVFRYLFGHDAHAATDVSRMRLVVLGGEEARREDLELFQRRFDPGCLLVNGLGPTESTLALQSFMNHSSRTDRRRLAVGYGVDGTRVDLLNRRGQAGEVLGEIGLISDYLALGYWRRPRLTATAFSPASDGGRRYRSGDLGRLRADDALEFVGRRDAQLKIRGHRIEPGEIETTLVAHPAVSTAAVVAVADHPSEKQLAAYVVPDPEVPTTAADLKSFLRERLPEMLVPSSVTLLDALPLTPNGKLDRAALPAPRMDQGSDVKVVPRTETERRVAEIWRRVLEVEEVGVRDNFFDVGGHSLRLLRVHALLRQELGSALSITELFEYPTIETLVGRLERASEPDGRSPRGLNDRESSRPSAGSGPDLRAGRSSAIAIIGMAGRFPKAPELATFWRNLCDGVESISFFSEDELRREGVPERMLSDPKHVRAFGSLDGVDLFDAEFFGFTPREAEITDPQQRILLECASEALEHAGYDPERYEGLIGVYAGAGKSSYDALLASRPELLEAVGRLQLAQATEKDYLTTRISYKLGLRGPSINVQTACSTSLVAVHEACRSLVDGQCDLALAGGISVRLPQKWGYLYEKGGILSPDGHCRPFDAQAEGTLGGSGGGLVVLKRLDEAIRDGDRIRAVIRGTAINNDGDAKIGYTAPGARGQAQVVAAAQAAAGVSAETIGYVEAHGTGTPLGDPIEISALTRAFREHTQGHGFCAIGSIKSNIGHLDAAAGVAGLIKTALALEHRQIPPSLHFETANPQIDFAGSPFFVNTECRDFERRDGRPLRAAVSSFGIGGTNAHAVLEEAPTADPSPDPTREWQLLALSARDAAALERQTSSLAAHLQSLPPSGSSAALADIAYTLQVGRRQFEHRRAVLCRDVGGAVAALEGKVPPDVVTRVAGTGDRPVAFMFPGQGAQYVDMGRGLYDSEPVYRETVDKCLTFLASEEDLDLGSVLHPAGATEAAARRLTDTSLAQPALFVIEHALATLWRSWGVEPDALIGHSVGEFVAATSSGVLAWRDALRLVTLRGRLMSDQPGGAMLAVPLAEDQVNERLAGMGDLWLSAINAPSLCAVSGTEQSIDALARQLAEEGLECRRLHTSHAFHSGMMEAVVAPFVEAIRGVTIRAPRIPYLSNVTGRWVTESDIRDPAYWGRHIRQPVRFADGMNRLLEETDRVVLEVGPGQVLGSLARQHPACGDRPVVSSLRRPRSDQPDPAYLLGALGRLWTGGVSVSWPDVHGGQHRRRVELPTYPLDRRRFWVEEPSSRAAGQPPTLGRLASISDWFSAPMWRQAPPPVAAGDDHWLILGAGTPEGRAVERALVAAGVTIQDLDGQRAEEPATPGGFTARLPPRIALCGVDADGGLPALLDLAKRLEALAGSQAYEVAIVCSGLHEVTDDERRDPRAAALDAFARVMAQELAGVSCRTVDVGDGVGDSQLAAELTATGGPPTVALRTGRRWLLDYQPVVVGGAGPVAEDGKVYLLTGGLGRIGLALAESLARDARVTLVLSSRTPLQRSDAADPRAEAVRGLEGLGATVELIPADLGDPGRTAGLIREIDARCGRLDGVIHTAGVTGERSRRAVTKLDVAACEAQLAPKQHGLVALDQALRGRVLDFRVATSSISTVVGGLEMAAYSAANAAMDAVASTCSDAWRTIALDGWLFDASEAAARSQALRLSMTPAEGVEVTRRAIRADPSLRHLIVSTTDLRARIERWVSASSAVDVPAQVAESAAETPAQTSATIGLAAPETPMQREIAGMWHRLLGIEDINIHDDFFELGGHSLLAMRLLANLEQSFGVELPVRVIFEAPTVLALEAEITRRLAEDQDEAELAQMISEVEGLSDEELKALLEEQPS